MVLLAVFLLLVGMYVYHVNSLKEGAWTVGNNTYTSRRGIPISRDKINEELNKLTKDALDPKGVSIARVNAVKLKQQQIHWHLGKLIPKKYGTSTQLQVSGKKDEPVVFKWQE